MELWPEMGAGRDPQKGDPGISSATHL